MRDEAGGLVPLHRADDPERWLEQVRADAPIVTRVGRDPALPAEMCDPDTGKGMVSTSSSSAPFIMARLIEALELEPGMRILEIGTGTGYNAAVLARILGGENVVSVEIDAVAAFLAREALKAVGVGGEVVTGDGEGGYPPGAPYERIVATASVQSVPYAWVRQVRPGGLIVVPLAPTVHPDWPLVVLRVLADGTARGRCVGSAPFMSLRGRHVSPRSVREAEERWVAEGEPEISRYGMTVTPAGQRVWLDRPENPAG
ncbi:rRNA adenine N-6-methyltransferase family protein [Actinomadura algeriensis]|uniref:Protein-L-isoaspartate O-methyltransferase n=1 Tax=Actinomadura algeriensis TaxID=1679523 RepID=A0ABR9JQ02_9ACTN|nr:methyltransferase domain-containing protein [Actinomadura algeriensis]MBE1532499.1 protein-L-isoaspartate(D-aspartate) O-methyltransferase [Actinomadura algeriensis]